MSNAANGMSDFSQKDEPHHDVEALRKLVADLKAESQQLSNEKKVLEEETKEFEASTSALKQEFNIIGAAADISGWDDSLHNGDGAAQVFATKDTKWFEENRKLEVKILNEEMRGILQKLEKDALMYESNIFAIEKQALLAQERQKLLPALLNKSSSELEEEMGIIIEKRLKVKATMKLQVDAATKEKMRLLNSISRARERLCSLVDEREAMKTLEHGLKLNIATSDSTIEQLKREILDVRNEFDRYLGPHGWLKEAYQGTVADTSEQTHMRVDDIFASLEGWSFVLNKENPAVPPLLQQKLREVGVSKYIDSRKFVHVCSALESELAEKNVD